MAAPQAVIFDVDGTLVDSVDLHAEAWQVTLQRWGHDMPFAHVRSQIGKGGDQLLPYLLSEAECERDGGAIEAARSDFFKQRFLSRVRPFPGVLPLFQAIQAKGLQIALATSGKPEELDHHKRLLGIDGLALLQTTAADAERSKPHPDIFQAALQKLGLAGDQAIVVGDTPYDATAASEAGLACIGLRCGGFAEADLRQAGCIAIYDDPADLHAGLGQSPLFA